LKYRTTAFAWTWLFLDTSSLVESTGFSPDQDEAGFFGRHRAKWTLVKCRRIVDATLLLAQAGKMSKKERELFVASYI
jgi:hypothetical protein